MSTQAKEKLNEFARIYWTADDIKTVKPDWTVEQCEDFLGQVERQLEDTVVERGWDFINDLASSHKV